MQHQIVYFAVVQDFFVCCPDDHPQVAKAWKDLLSGVVGGASVVVAGHPLDTVPSCVCPCT